jgi:hypothetical protein
MMMHWIGKGKVNARETKTPGDRGPATDRAGETGTAKGGGSSGPAVERLRQSACLNRSAKRSDDNQRRQGGVMTDATNTHRAVVMLYDETIAFMLKAKRG